jgi:hypothetical protein
VRRTLEALVGDMEREGVPLPPVLEIVLGWKLP